MKIYDCIIIGGGQAGLSVAYFLRKYAIDYLILDDQMQPGGSWLNTWDSLTLFSPVTYSTLSGWMMPQGENTYPGKDEFIQYLKAYENRYNFPVKRPVQVAGVSREDNLFVIETNQGPFRSETIVSATGSSKHPFIPAYPNSDHFTGKMIHSSEYRRPDEFEGKKVLIVGGGNSGAQILAEVSKVAQTQWITLEEPRFLPDHVDGRFLFQEATSKFLKKPSSNKVEFSLGDIVMLESVKEASTRGVLNAKRPFKSFYEEGVVWPDGKKEQFDAVIWCTGFKTYLQHLDALNVVENGRVATKFTRSLKEPKLWLVGYGNWTGFASATIYGVGKTARQTALEINEALRE